MDKETDTPPEPPISKEEAIAMLKEGQVEEWNKLREEKLWEADLKDADLKGAHLEGVNLIMANLEGANLREANLKGADLSEANLKGAVLNGANLEGADLEGANLKGADLREANLKGADLRESNLKGADLMAANLEKANVAFVRFNRICFQGRNRWSIDGRYRGIRVDSCHGNARFKRMVQDEDFVEEFKAAWWRYPLYIIWLILADCGRSLWPWIGWSILFAVWFGFKFASFGPEAFHLVHLPWSIGAMIYYSVVTFTTLGFGDIAPKTLEAAYWVMAEVIVGYVMLGGLISILATKLARRS
ncbi:MAG: pentapeptide repeat-containing protein [Candidatus Alcyoniella australis]|nr:pentapeptide repeat-containing protein [Candidatus Alcyoniella australis]